MREKKIIKVHNCFIFNFHECINHLLKATHVSIFVNFIFALLILVFLPCGYYTMS